MPAQLEGLAGRKYACTYDKCPQAFDSQKEMKAHKLKAPEHDYCKKCNMDFDSWDELTQHKVDIMAPFLEGNFIEATAAADKVAHIVCEFCGEEFKTFGGRKLHRTRLHPADQCITCKGCNRLFTRAANLIAHYEFGECTGVSKRDFEGEKQKKHIHKQMMIAPDKFVQNIETNVKSQVQVASDSQRESSLSSHDTTTQDDIASVAEEGGVLLDEDDGFEGEDPMAAEIDLMSFKDAYYKEHPEQAPLTRRNLEYGRTVEPTPAEAMARMTLGSGASSVATSEYSRVTSRRGGLKVFTENTVSSKAASDAPSGRDGSEYHLEGYPSLTSPVYDESAQSSYQGSDTASEATTTQGPQGPTQATPRGPTAWTTGNTATALFKDPNPTTKHPTLLNPYHALAPQTSPARRQAAAADPTTNLFRLRFWDPSSPDYNATRFYHAAIQLYCCPFPDCTHARYESVEELEVHLTMMHATQQHRCPGCLKVFKTAVGLVSHCEAAGGGRCKVQETGMYRKLIDEISGGYLQAHRVAEAPIYHPEDEQLIPHGAPTGGVAKTQYEATLPRQR